MISQMSRQSQTLKQTVTLGIFFMLLVTTYNSFSHIVNYIAETTDSLYPFEGELALIINYFVYLVGLTRAPSIKDYKRQFLIAAVCYSLNYALYLFQFDQLLGLLASILGAILGGYGASVLWVSQGGYLMKLFKKYQIEKNSEGYYLGIQNGLVYASGLLGSVIITFGLGLFGNLVYFLILTVIGMLAFLMCWLFLDPLEQIQEQINQQQLRCSHFWQNLMIVLRFFKNMKLLIAAMILDGFMLGFATSSFSDIVPQHIRSSLNIGIVLIVNGAGAIIGGYLSGSLSDKISPSQLGIIGFHFLIITFLITMLTDYIRFETLTFPTIIGLLWGIGLYFLQGWIFVCCAKIYQGKMQTFAVVKQVHTFSFILFQVARIIFNSHINTSIFLIILIALSIAAIYSCMRMQILERNNKHDEMVQEASPPVPFD